MRKRVFGRQFKKDINQRKALFKGLMRSLALNEQIKTTEAKAKSIQSEFERHITRAKDGEEARYHLVKHLSEDAVDRLIKDIAPRMKDRNGGYTRIVRLGTRLKDKAEMVLLELIEKKNVEIVVSKKGKGSKGILKKADKAEKQAESNVSKLADKKSILKPIANVKKMVSRQKKGQS